MVDAARTPDYWTRPNRQAARAYSFLSLQKGTGRKCLNTNNVKLSTAFSAALISSTTLWKGRKEGGMEKGRTVLSRGRSHTSPFQHEIRKIVPMGFIIHAR